jgi:hypothetical protein
VCDKRRQQVVCALQCIHRVTVDRTVVIASQTPVLRTGVELFPAVGKERVESVQMDAVPRGQQQVVTKQKDALQSGTCTAHRVHRVSECRVGRAGWGAR